VDLELEPPPPDPPPPPRPAPPPNPFRIARRAAIARLSKVRLWTPKSLARSTILSVLAHAAAFALLWLVFSLHDSAPSERVRTVHIRLSAAEAADPEAVAGGTAPKPEVPKEAERGAAGTAPGLLADDEHAATTVGAGAAPAGAAFVGRTGGRERLLESGGGDAATEGAVQMALAWLARHQSADGTWQAASFLDSCRTKGCEGRGEAEYAEATTALALLPFLGAGHTHKAGPWKDTVKRGVLALAARQRADGSFGTDAKRGYACAIATLALAEAYGLTGTPSLREPAQLAVDHLVRTQSPQGGWRYHPGDGAADSSITGWAAVAVGAARKAGLQVPQRTIDGASAWFANVRDDQGQYGYLSRGGGTASLLGVATFAQLMLGTDPESPKLAPTFDLLERRLPRLSRGPDDASEEYGVADPIHWTYGALAAFQRGGGTWKVWNDRLRAAVLPSQVRDDSEARGSWPPMGATGRHGGRVVTTVFCTLALEVYYRYPRVLAR
jgi:hypothetical protein